jgi:hypothetical protein
MIQLPDLPDDAEMPAFRALTDNRKRFVIGLLKWGAGKGHRTKIAQEAGYQGDERTLAVRAYECFHNKTVQAAMREMAETHLLSFQLMAIDGIATLAEGARDEGVKLKALIALANRTGFQEIQTIDVRHEDVNKTEDQKIEQMVAICMRRPDLLVNVASPRRELIEAKIAERRGDKPGPAVITASYTVVERDPDADLFGE